MANQLIYFCGDDSRGFYVKGHIDLAEFMELVRREVDSDDQILQETPTHCWMRSCRDFQNETSILVEAEPNSRGAFKCTWIQVY